MSAGKYQPTSDNNLKGHEFFSFFTIIKTSQLIYIANQSIGFCIMRTLLVNGLNIVVWSKTCTRFWWLFLFLFSCYSGMKEHGARAGRSYHPDQLPDVPNFKPVRFIHFINAIELIKCVRDKRGDAKIVYFF